MYTLQNMMLTERKDNLQKDTYSLMLFSSALKHRRYLGMRTCAVEV